jgi:hypothetical protein
VRIFFALIAALTLLPEASPAQDVIVTIDSPLESKLASLDAQSAIVDRSKFPPYAQLLSDLDRSCKETRTQIGTLVMRTVGGLWKKEINVTHLKFLRSMKDAIPANAQASTVSCGDIAALVVATLNRQ